MFDKGSQRLNPIPGVEIMDIPQLFVFRIMDVSADHSVAVPLFGNGLEMSFERGNIIYGRFDSVLYRPGE